MYCMRVFVCAFYHVTLYHCSPAGLPGVMEPIPVDLGSKLHTETSPQGILTLKAALSEPRFCLLKQNIAMETKRKIMEIHW